MNYVKKMFFIFAVIYLVNIPVQIKPYPHIPLKGLFEVLKIDDIGFAHALLHSKWIENMYQYGEGKPPSRETKNEPVFANDPIADLVRILWFRFSEEHSLEPTQAGVLGVLTPTVFGKLINEIYRESEDYQELVEQWSKVYVANIKEVEKKLDLAKEEQKEYKRLSKQVLELAKRLTVLGKRYNRMWKVYEGQLEQHNLALSKFKDDPIEANKMELAKLEKGLEKIRKDIEEFRGKKRAGELEILPLQKKLQSMPDPKKKVEDIKWALRKIGSYLEVKKLDLMSQPVIDAIKNQIKQVIDIIKKAVAFCEKKDVYVLRTTRAILWAFFFHKIDKLRSQGEKIEAIKACIAEIDEDFKNKVDLEVLYSLQELDAFEKQIKDLDASQQILEIFKNYDLAMHFLISKLAGNFPPKISQGSFGYEYEKGKISTTRPNCYETAMHDLFSILWYNSKKGTYDNSIFSKTILRNGKGFQRFRNALSYFYLADCKGIKAEDYKVDKKFTSLSRLKDLKKINSQEVESLPVSAIPVSFIDRSVMRQEFMNIVSGLPKIKYHWEVDGKKIFELFPSVKNFINVCNYFYGIQADIVEDLGKLLSTEKREIQFKKDSDQDVPNKITITVHDKENRAYFDMIADIMTGHVSLSVPDREQVALKIVKKGFVIDLLKRLVKERELADLVKYTTVFTLFTSKKLLKEKQIGLALPTSNLIYYSLIMKGPEVKLAIIEDVLERHPSYYNACKGMVLNLLSDFPFDDRFFRIKLNKILELALEKGYKEIAEIIVKKEDFDVSGKALSVALKKHYEDIAGKIAKNPRFRLWGAALSFALEKEWKGVALVIVKNEKFDASFAQDALKLALEKEYQDIAFAIVKNEEFDAHYVPDALKLALEKEYKDIAFTIVNNKKFDASFARDALKLALEKEYKDIAFAIVNNKKFDASFARDALKLALEKEYKDIAFAIVNNKKFDASFAGDALKLALEKEYKDIAFAIVKNEKFDASFAGDALKLALEKEYKDIALVIMKNEKFDASSAEDALKLALEKEYKDIAFAIVKNEKFDASYVSDALKLALQKEYKDIAEVIVKNEKFNVSCYGIADVLKLALEKEYKDIAEVIVKNEKFDASGDGIGDAFSLALKKGYDDIAKKISEKPEFVAWGSAVEFALEKGWKDIALKIFSYPRFDISANGFGKALVLALEKEEYKKIAEKILRDPKFEDWSGAVDFAIKKDLKDIALKLLENPQCNVCEKQYLVIDALKKGFLDVALKIIGHDTFDFDYNRMGEALVLAMEKGYKNIITEITEHKAFNASGIGFGKALAFALKNKEYNYVAEKILSNSNFKRWGEAISFAAKNGWKSLISEILNNTALNFGPQGVKSGLDSVIKLGWEDFASKIVEHHTFNASSEDFMDSTIERALEKGLKDIALKIVNHPTFDITKFDNLLYILDSL